MKYQTSHICTTALLLLLSATPGWSQQDSCKSELTFGLDFMTHGEMCGGGLPKDFNTQELPPENSTAYIMGRTRINAEYKSALIDAKVTAQNQASWGSQNNSTLTLYEGWAKIKAPFGLYGQLGRMELSYDDERILGPNDFAMAKLCHDVLRVGYEGHGHKVHAILAYNQNNDHKLKGTYYADGAQPYKTMQVLWYHYDVPRIPIGASLLFINVGMQAGEEGIDAHTEHEQLIGTYLTYAPRFMKAEFSYYRQMGHNDEGIKIEAWMASGKVTLKPSDRYGIFAGYDYLSGDDYVPVIAPGAIGMPRHEVIKSFSTVYGSHHKFYGIMDYFYESAYSQGFSPGLRNAFIGGYYQPIAPLKVGLSYHYLATATELEGLESTLGHNLDLNLSYVFSKDISLTAGFSYMHGTNTMDMLKQGTASKNVRWGWFSLFISPRLFSTKW